MPTLATRIQKPGITFSNSFVTTPVCCPSRSSIMSGMYQHNTRCVRNSISGGCSSQWWQENVEQNHTFAVHLHRAGWKTGYFGKYLNQYAKDKAGVARVPPGWTEWLGLAGNSVYYDYTLSNNGNAEKHGNNYATDYLVDLLANRSSAFLLDSFRTNNSANVLAMVGTPAAHNPYDPAPQYATDPGLLNESAPRTPNWNVGREGKHWLVGEHRVMGDGEINFSDLTFRRRLMTLRSLDDLLAKLIHTLEGAGRFDSCWFLFTADNGFHSGQFTMPDDKRLPYEFDLRVPLIGLPPRPHRRQWRQQQPPQRKQRQAEGSSGAAGHPRVGRFHSLIRVKKGLKVPVCNACKRRLSLLPVEERTLTIVSFDDFPCTKTGTFVNQFDVSYHKTLNACALSGLVRNWKNEPVEPDAADLQVEIALTTGHTGRNENVVCWLLSGNTTSGRPYYRTYYHTDLRLFFIGMQPMTGQLPLRPQKKQAAATSGIESYLTRDGLNDVGNSTSLVLLCNANQLLTAVHDCGSHMIELKHKQLGPPQLLDTGENTAGGGSSSGGGGGGGGSSLGISSAGGGVAASAGASTPASAATVAAAAVAPVTTGPARGPAPAPAPRRSRNPYKCVGCGSQGYGGSDTQVCRLCTQAAVA
eukprot:g664.t1